MSWSLSVTAVPVAEVEAKLVAAKDAQLTYSTFDSWDDAIETQMEAAFATAVTFAKLVKQELVNVTAAGHAALPGQSPIETINVYVTGYVPPPTTPVPAPPKK